MRRAVVLSWSAVVLLAGCSRQTMEGIPGLGLTSALWLGAREKQARVESAQLSPDGALCIVYKVRVEVAGGLGVVPPMRTNVIFGGNDEFDARRGLVLPAAHIGKVLARAGGESSVEMDKGELLRFVRPRSAGSRTNFDPDSIPGHSKDWAPVPVSSGKPMAFPYPRHARGDAAVGAEGAGTVTVRLCLPERSSVTAWSCPRRVLLTPLTLAADVAFDAPVVVLLPPGVAIWGAVKVVQGIRRTFGM